MAGGKGVVRRWETLTWRWRAERDRGREIQVDCFAAVFVQLVAARIAS
jgi:hypothetical protein